MSSQSARGANCAAAVRPDSSLDHHADHHKHPHLARQPNPAPRGVQTASFEKLDIHAIRESP